jgi:hypothetical protein
VSVTKRGAPLDRELFGGLRGEERLPQNQFRDDR